MFEYRATIVRVIDGDTVVADIDLGMNVWRRNEPLRLYGVNAPEVVGADKAAGLAAKDWLVSIFEGKRVTIRTQKDKTEKYGRWLAVIDLEGVNINAAIIAVGLAKAADASGKTLP